MRGNSRSSRNRRSTRKSHGVKKARRSRRVGTRGGSKFSDMCDRAQKTHAKDLNRVSRVRHHLIKKICSKTDPFKYPNRTAREMIRLWKVESRASDLERNNQRAQDSNNMLRETVEELVADLNEERKKAKELSIRAKKQDFDTDYFAGRTWE